MNMGAFYSIVHTSVGWHRRTARRVASHRVVIVLCTKLDAECERQATVVSRLLTTLGDDGRTVTKLFSIFRVGSSGGTTHHMNWLEVYYRLLPKI